MTGDSPQPGETPRHERDPWSFADPDAGWWRGETDRSAAETSVRPRHPRRRPPQNSPFTGGTGVLLPPGFQRADAHTGPAAGARAAGARDAAGELDPALKRRAAESAAIEELRIYELPREQPPTQQLQAEPPPPRERWARDQPTREQPVQGQPAQERPVQDQTVQERPVQERPVQERPVQERRTPEPRAGAGRPAPAAPPAQEGPADQTRTEDVRAEPDGVERDHSQPDPYRYDPLRPPAGYIAAPASDTVAADQPPAAEFPPAETTQPTETTPPSATTPPAETTPPSATTPPAETTPPTKTTQPSATTQPAETTRPGATTQRPTMIQPGDMIQPGGMTPPGDTTPPADTTRPGDTTPPADTTWPGAMIQPPDMTRPGATIQPPDMTILPEPGSRSRPTVALDRNSVPGQSTSASPRHSRGPALPSEPLPRPTGSPATDARLMKLENSPFWLSEQERAARPPLPHRPAHVAPARRRRSRHATGRPAPALVALLALTLVATFFAWVSAEPFWLAIGHGEPGYATTTGCVGAGVTQRCAGQFTAGDGAYSITRVTLLGVASDQRAGGTVAPAQMVNRDSRHAYLGDTGLLVQLRWILGFLLVLMCGYAIAGVTGARRLESSRARRGALLCSLAGPLVLLAGFLLATY